MIAKAKLGRYSTLRASVQPGFRDVTSPPSFVLGAVPDVGEGFVLPAFEDLVAAIALEEDSAVLSVDHVNRSPAAIVARDLDLIPRLRSAAS